MKRKDYNLASPDNEKSSTCRTHCAEVINPTLGPGFIWVVNTHYKASGLKVGFSHPHREGIDPGTLAFSRKLS